MCLNQRQQRRLQCEQQQQQRWRKKINFILECLKELIRNFTIIVCRCHRVNPTVLFYHHDGKLHQVKADRSTKKRMEKRTKEANEMRRRNDENLLISAHYLKHCITKMRSLPLVFDQYVCELHFPHFLSFHSLFPSFRCFAADFSFGWLFAFAFAFFNFILDSVDQSSWVDSTDKSLIDHEFQLTSSQEYRFCAYFKMLVFHLPFHFRSILRCANIIYFQHECQPH